MTMSRPPHLTKRPRVSRGRRRALLACAALALALGGWWVYAAEPGGTAPPVLHKSAKWSALPELPIGVFLAGASAVERQVVVTGGVNQVGATEAIVQVLDAEHRSWRTPLRLKTPRCQHAQVTLQDGRVFVAGGQTGSVPRNLKPLASTEIINLESGTVTAGPPLPRVVPTAAAHLLADGRVAIVGGGAATIYNPATNKWVRNIVFRESRLEAASTLLDDGRILMVGGTNRRSLEVMHPDQKHSKMLAAKLPHPMDDLAVVALPGKRAWVIGGQRSDTGRTTDRTWIVDLSNPRKSTITDGPRLGVAGGMADAAVARLGRWVAVVGGESDLGHRDEELAVGRLLDVDTAKVWALPPLTKPHDDAAAVALPDAIVVVGGYRISTPIKALEALGVPTAASEAWRLQTPSGGVAGKAD